MARWPQRLRSGVPGAADGASALKERARDRVPADDEVGLVVAAAERDDGPFGSYLQFTLLTATRRGESAGLRRSELSDGGADVARSRLALQKWQGHFAPNVGGRAEDHRIDGGSPLAGGDYVFSADGSRPLGGWDNRKKNFDVRCGITENR